MSMARAIMERYFSGYGGATIGGSTVSERILERFGVLDEISGGMLYRAQQGRLRYFTNEPKALASGKITGDALDKRKEVFARRRERSPMQTARLERTMNDRRGLAGKEGNTEDEKKDVTQKLNAIQKRYNLPIEQAAKKLDPHYVKQMKRASKERGGRLKTFISQYDAAKDDATTPIEYRLRTGYSGPPVKATI